MSAKGVGTEEVVSQITTNLEEHLGSATKDEIIQRASSILALAKPFEVGAFEYYRNLSVVFKRTTDFCVDTNIFKLRAEADGSLLLPYLSSKLGPMFDEFRAVSHQLLGGDVFRVRLDFVGAYLPAFGIKLGFELEKGFSVGGSYKERKVATLLMVEGDEVNKAGFKIRFEGYYLQQVQFRLTATDFQQIVAALLRDINAYVTDLAQEERNFKENIAPSLEALLSQWPKV
jgi:hypothetical protein